MYFENTEYEYSPTKRCEWCDEFSNVLNRVYRIKKWSKFYLRYMCQLCILDKNRRNEKYLLKKQKICFIL